MSIVFHYHYSSLTWKTHRCNCPPSQLLTPLLCLLTHKLGYHLSSSEFFWSIRLIVPFVFFHNQLWVHFVPRRSKQKFIISSSWIWDLTNLLQTSCLLKSELKGANWSLCFPYTSLIQSPSRYICNYIHCVFRAMWAVTYLKLSDERLLWTTLLDT